MDLNDKQLAYALTTLRAEPRFKRVRDALQGQLAEELDTIPAILDSAQLRQAQGRCQMLQEILSDFDNAATVYEKHQNNRKGGA